MVIFNSYVSLPEGNHWWEQKKRDLKSYLTADSKL